MSRLWPFNGGVHLDTHKEESTRRPLAEATLPGQLIFPLLTRSGLNALPLVEAGDRVLKGQVIAREENSAGPPIHASSSGIVRGIEERLLPHPSGMSDLCIVIDTDGEDEAIEFTGTTDYAHLSPAELRRRIHAAGIVGLGGAGFPTAIKVDPGERRPVDTLILNGAECEPYITCDDSLLRRYPHEVLSGAKILMHILQVERCLLGIEADMPEAIAALEASLVGGDFRGVQIVPVPAIYPTGGEKQLIRVLTGREVPSGRIPADAGVVCQNVGTAAAVHRAIVAGEPLISRIVTISGRGVGEPRNLLVRLGTPIAELIEQCGGYTPQAHRLILGGPMMGFALPSDEVPITKASNCVLATAPGEIIGEKLAMPCIRCGECAKACPVSLLPQQLYWYSRADDLDRAQDYRLADCIECGCCDVVCPSHIPLVQHFRSAKSRGMTRQRERQKAEHARQRFDARQQRKEREKLEKADAARRKKALLAQAPELQHAMEKAKALRAGREHDAPNTPQVAPVPAEAAPAEEKAS